MSAGTWHGAEVAGDNNARYLLQVSSSERFTITVTPSAGRSLAQVAKADPADPALAAQQQQRAASTDDEDDVSVSTGPASTGHSLLSSEELENGSAYVYVGHRIRTEENKSFFQKYGTMMLLGGMLLVNIWMRTRQSGTQLTAQQRVAQAQAVAGTSRRPPPSSARIEEITEGNINLDSKKGK